MKVALIVEWLDAWRGGAETSTQQFIAHLIDLGVELEIYTRSRLSPRPQMAVHTIKSAGPSRAFRTLSFCRRADEAVRAGDCDLVHAIAPSMAADIYQPRGGTYAETIRRNLALRTHRPARMLKRLAQGVNVKQRMLLQFEREMLTREDGPMVIALSDYVIDQLHRHYHLPDERIRKIFNGVDPDETDSATRAQQRCDVRSLYEIGKNDLLVLTVAHNFKLKGVRTLIEALSLLSGDPALAHLRALVVGKDKILAWQRLVDRRGLDRVVQFPGASQRIRAFYHAADVLCHPTFYDPCSRVVLEAQAAGLPCITTRFDGAAEVLEDGVTGYVLDAPEDATALADRLRRLADPATRQRMADAAHAAPGADMHRHAQAVVDLYQSLNGRRRG